MPRLTPHYAVVSCMRNEAIFVLEWIAYQLALGFHTVAVVTNDSDDNTDLMVHRLSRADDRILHIPNQIATGETPQMAGMRLALDHPRLAGADYLLHCDSDEFLHVDQGAGRVEDLMGDLDGADCVALAWRPFGDNGNTEWDCGLVLENCTMADKKPRMISALHKCVFRPSRFRLATDHMPKFPLSDDVSLVNARGEQLDRRALENRDMARLRGLQPHQLVWSPACIHHYAIRSRDVFLRKNDRGDGMAGVHRKYYLNSVYWRRYNRSIVPVPAAQQHLAAVRRIVAEFRSDRRISRWETQAQQAFHDWRAAHLTPGRIAEWTEDRALAPQIVSQAA